MTDKKRKAQEVTPTVVMESVENTEHKDLPEGADLETANDKMAEVMGFKLGEEEYAIDIMRIKEITPLLDLTPIPRAPSYILGILSLRGNILPIFDAKKKMGLPDTVLTEKARIIVLKNEDEQVGLLVDSITSAAQIPEKSIEPPPSIIRGVEAEYVKGIGRYKGRMMIIMNIDEIIRME